MPKRGRTSFTNTKRGKNHNERGGGGRGFRGRRRLEPTFSPPEPDINELVSQSPMCDNSDAANVSEQESTSDSSQIPTTQNTSDSQSVKCDVSSAGNATEQESSSDSSSSQMPTTQNTSDSQSLKCDVSSAVNATEQESSSDSSSFQLPTDHDPPSKDTIEGAHKFVVNMLPNNWICVQEKNGFNVFLMSRSEEKVTQRRVFMAFDGSVNISAHCKPVNESVYNEILKTATETVPLKSGSEKEFVDRCVTIVNSYRGFEVCAGCDFDEYECIWSFDKNGIVDNNPYQESRYEKTYRSTSCAVIVKGKTWRCKRCQMLSENLKKKLETHSKPLLHRNTPNIHLNKEESLNKLKNQKRTLENNRRLFDRLQAKIKTEINEKGCHVDSELSTLLEDTLKENKLTQVQEVFIQQQLKASDVHKNGMRWHPVMIRLALAIKTVSQSALDTIRATGIVKLPGDRTLRDYSDILPKTEGLHEAKLDRLIDKVKTYPEEYQRYHNLLFDEVHISHKLVYQKSTGLMVGYVNQLEVEQEAKNLEDIVKENLTGTPIDSTPPVATKILTFMVRGVSNGIRESVASYTTGDRFTKQELYDRVWDVIEALEGAGVKLIACICDGSAINRGFIDMHTPVTKTDSGVIFDTVNLAAPDRALYFISDPPHLLKTIRNCFAKSGKGKKYKRLMVKKNEEIVWNTIIRLFYQYKNDNLRKSYKLNAHNVFLNSYSCMKVLPAAQVLSKTVAEDLRLQNWPNTAETVKFLLNANDFFDMLNGASSEHGHRTANPNLEPYRSVDDERITDVVAPDGAILKRCKLMQYWDYLQEWQTEVNALKCSAKEKKKKTLAKQTIDGIEMTIRGFSGAVKFLLKEGTKFINARVFCQDPLEQYFGKQRQSCGGSRNPNVPQFLANENKIALTRDLNVKKRSGNTMAENKCMALLDGPPLKRKRKS